jgi:hypothetical protein
MRLIFRFIGVDMDNLTDFADMDNWTYTQIREEIKQAIEEASHCNTARFDHVLRYTNQRRPGGVTWNQLEARIALSESRVWK